MRSTSRSADSGDTPASGRCGRSASAPSSPASTTAGTSAWAPVGSAACSSPACSWRSCTTASSTRSPRCRPRSRTPGGAYSFARSAMGPWGGFLTGLAENMEYVITPAVVVGAMALLMQEIVGGPVRRRPASPWWNSLPVLVGCLLRHLRGDQHRRHRGHDAVHRGDHASCRIAVLVFFFIAAIFSGKLDFNLWTNISKDGERDPRGRRSVAPVRGQRDLQVPPVRDLVLPRDRGGAARG